MYDAIIVSGMSYDFQGRPLGPYRLRTAAENHGYSVKVIDFVSTLSETQLYNLLSKIVTEQTKVIGFSSSWFELNHEINPWATNSFFNLLKTNFSNVKIVVGGTKVSTFPVMQDNADWFFTGFSDISFVKLLNILSGKKDKLLYIKNNKGVKIVDSDTHYRVHNMDDIETVYKKEDDFKPFQPLTIEVSRGCIFKCAFCTHPFLGKKNYEYIRTPENISIELKRNYDLFGTTKYFVADDTFNDSIEKIDRLARAVDLAKLPDFQFVAYIRPELLVTKPEMAGMLKNLGLKGCHFGIESLNNPARKAIGKGMEIAKILDMSRNFYAETKARIHATLILGLPGDKKEDFYSWQEFLVKNRFELYSSWKYNTLGIMNPKYGKPYSLIEKEPEKYGYTLIDSKEVFVDWENRDGLNRKHCWFFEKKFNTESLNYCRPGGLNVGIGWYNNVPDEDMINKTWNQLDLWNLAKRNHRIRTAEELKKYNVV